MPLTSPWPTISRRCSAEFPPAVLKCARCKMAESGSWVMRDIDIRRALRREMEQRHGKEANTRLVEELGLCQGTARVDVAIVNGSVHGYEIKSAHDTLVRLPGQTRTYSRALDFVTIITAPAHAIKIRKIIPRWWGIWSAVKEKDGVRLKECRESRPNPAVDPYSLAQLLWRDEALQALADRGLAAGMRSKPREELWRKLASQLSREELGRVVRECIKCRGANWRRRALPM